MLRVTCSNCTSAFDTADSNAGKQVTCPNCRAPLTVPAAPGTGSPGPAPDVAANRAVVPSTPGMITGNPNMIGVIILWLLLNGLQYFYMRQIGKGAILTAIDIMFLMLTLFFCGIPLLLWTPWRIIWLIDTIIVTNRLRKEPISQWRFF